MPVPGFQSLMRPILVDLADGAERSMADMRDRLAGSLGITAEDRAETLPSSTQSRYANRVGWAATYLVKTKLLERPRRAHVQITARGREVLTAHSDKVDLRVLSRFPELDEFRSARTPRRQDTAALEDATMTDALSPTESVADLIDEANSTVAADILARIQANPPAFLERFVLQLLSRMGYGGLEATTEHLGGPGDEGLDGIIRQDALGLEVIYIQAKRYAAHRKIGRPDIQGFVGALVGAKAERGIFITTSSFTSDAKSYARQTMGTRVVLIDGQELARMMVDRNVGAEVAETYELKRVDEDFFEE